MDTFAVILGLGTLAVISHRLMQIHDVVRAINAKLEQVLEREDDPLGL